MSKKIKAILIILIIVVATETWFLTKIWKAENNVIPGGSNIYTSLSDGGFEDTLVGIDGTWFSETKLAYPVQSSKIDCWKDKGACFEALGNVKDNYLNVDLLVYDIISWNDKEIIAKYDAICKSTELKINREQKQATQVATIKKTDGICSSMSKDPILVYLMKGYEAWQKNNEKK